MSTIAGSPVVLVNRTLRTLTFTADGQHYELQPGDNYGFNEGHAAFARKQNPRMGSEDYQTLRFESLVGVKGRDNCEIVDEEQDKAIERFDRMTIPGGENFVLVPVRHRPIQGRISGSMAGAESMAAGD